MRIFVPLHNNKIIEETIEHIDKVTIDLWEARTFMKNRHSAKQEGMLLFKNIHDAEIINNDELRVKLLSGDEIPFFTKDWF